MHRYAQGEISHMNEISSVLEKRFPLTEIIKTNLVKKSLNFEMEQILKCFHSVTFLRC